MVYKQKSHLSYGERFFEAFLAEGGVQFKPGNGCAVLAGLPYGVFEDRPSQPSLRVFFSLLNDPNAEFLNHIVR